MKTQINIKEFNFVYNKLSIKLDILNNKILVKGPLGCLENHFYFLNATVTYNYFYLNKNDYKLLLAYIYIMFKSLKYGWLIQLELIGLSFKYYNSVKENILKIDIGFTHYIYLPIPKDVIILTKKRKLILFSLDKQKLMNLIVNFVSFRKLNVYKIKGIHVKNQIFQFKTGKKQTK
jgi:ribosomal protein L6P/L9E